MFDRRQFTSSIAVMIGGCVFYSNDVSRHQGIRQKDGAPEVALGTRCHLSCISMIKVIHISTFHIRDWRASGSSVCFELEYEYGE